MKYIDADKLKAKLDEHYRKYQSKYMETRSPYAQGIIDALDLAEQVIDSLQQEQQEVDLEKETKSWILNECGPSDFSPFADHWCADDIMATARHFYELGKSSK